MELYAGSRRIRRRQLRAYAAAALGLAALTTVVVALGCHLQPSDYSSGPPPEPIKPPLHHTITNEPTVRVRIVRSAEHVRLNADARVAVSLPDDASAGEAHLLAPPLTLRIQNGQLLVQPDHGPAYRWNATALRLRPVSGMLRVDNTPYPGDLLIHLRTGSRDNPSPPRLDVVNHVPMEQYLPGVLQRELYAHWQPSAFRAQAVAARSYAIFESARGRRRHFDVESTTASQAYAGASAHERARQAVRDTAGVVLTYQDRVVPTYYSSCCGGTSQNAAFAFPAGLDIVPLRGRDDGTWCTQSPTFRWSVRREPAELATRMAAWGRQNKHAVAQLKAIRDIRVTGTNNVGRPARFAVVDVSGRTFQMGPEEFRFACNTDVPLLPALPAAAKLKSSHVQPRMAGRQVHFDGRGHGHGVGMCQWCAQGMATHGYGAEQILQQSYPGAALVQLY